MKNAGISLVMGVDTQIGLAIVRELGRHGVHVVVLTVDPQALGAVSRHAAEVVQLAELRSESTLETIRRLGQRFGPCSLITVSETNIQWLASHRAELGPDVRPALPPPEAFATVTNKDRTLKIAQGIGIDVPRTEQPRSLGDFDAIARRFRFPVVLKWSGGGDVDVGRLLEQHRIEFRKAEYAYDAAGLLAIGRRYQPMGVYPLVQEYCTGQGFGQFFFMHKGRAVQRFQHLRVAEWPPEGGFSSVCDAVPLERHRELQERSLALLRAINWEGVAMVEYRLDEGTRRAVLMEINGRFWGSFPLASQAGAGFAWLTHRAALGLPLEDMAPPAARMRCRMVGTEIKRLARITLQPGRISDRSFKVRPLHELLRFVADFLRPGVRYYVWDRTDPAPFWADLRAMARRALGR